MNERSMRGSADDPVVITGIGMVTPLGSTAAETWANVLQGRAAGRWLDALDTGNASTDPTGKYTRWIGSPALLESSVSDDSVVSLAMHATAEAMADAGFVPGSFDSARTGCVIGTSKGSLFAATSTWQQTHSRPTAEFDLAACLFGPALASVAVANHWSLTGPRLAPVAACATGLASIVRAVDLVRDGSCDMVIAGSADDSLHPLVLASFQRMGVLATHEIPSEASRPFDRNRSGFVVGSGGGALILERRSHAVARGADWYAEIGRTRMLNDPTGMTALDTSGACLSRLMHDCTTPPGSERPRIPDVINLHGTGTRMNDPVECAAVKTVFGEDLEGVACGSLKGSLGHLLGAAGSVELGLCCLMLRDQIVPPNANLVDLDDECRLPWVIGAAQRLSIQSLLKTSLGFGGHQAALWLERGTAVGVPT